MALNPNEDTEFNDALRKHGILPPKTPPPRTPSPTASPTLDDVLADADLDEMRELADDAADSDTERMIETYRRQRIADISREVKLARFGDVIPIGRDDYKREVTDSSQVSETGDAANSGTGVVCLLYKDAHLPSDKIWPHIRHLARKHPRTKFVSIVGNKCIPDYPDAHLPTLFVYRKGELSGQVTAWGAQAERTIDALEDFLIQTLAIPPDDKSLGGADDDSDDEKPRRTRTATRTVASKGRRQSDDDSDFDL
ncbi:thioredoxin-like protein [Auriculariales sp. MPI-PUGE-AT-0066]|nr:thioredoxin-like protein [Auriculariales sp. MPI-PUGE-AT-0066]